MSEHKEWITAADAFRRLGIARETFLKVAATGVIRRRRLPGKAWFEYHAADVEALARESVIGQGVPEHGRCAEAV
jgi:hypothetical protein